MLTKSGVSWAGTGFLLALATGLLVLMIAGRHPEGVSLATRSIARVAFVFFWFAYAGGAVAAFLGCGSVAGYRRQAGLAFAGALSVHLAFVAWLFRISARQPISDEWVVYFVLGALGAYALVISSWPRLRALWENRLWRVFSIVVLEYIAFLFFRDFVLLPLQYWVAHPAEYFPFGLLIILGALLRWFAAARRWLGMPRNRPNASTFMR